MARLSIPQQWWGLGRHLIKDAFLEQDTLKDFMAAGQGTRNKGLGEPASITCNAWVENPATMEQHFIDDPHTVWSCLEILHLASLFHVNLQRWAELGQNF